MTFWKTLALFVLAAGLLAYALYADRHAVEEPKKGEVEFFTFDREQATGFRIDKGSTRVEVAKADDGNYWRITAPREYEADRFEVERFLDNLNELKSKAVIGRPEGSLADFGLDPPRGSYRVFLDGAPGPAVLLGAENPYGDGVYMMREGDDTVYLVHEWSGNRFDISMNDLRQKDINEFDDDAALRLDISFPRSGLPGGVLVRDKAPASEQAEGQGVGKDDDDEKDGEKMDEDEEEAIWRLAPPLDKPLDREKAIRLVGYLSALRAVDFMGKKTPEREKAGGLDNPRLEIVVTLEGGEERRVRLGDKEGEKGYYVEVDHRPEIYLISTYTFKAFPETIEDLLQEDEEGEEEEPKAPEEPGEEAESPAE